MASSKDRLALLDELVRAHQARLRAYLFSRTGDIDALAACLSKLPEHSRALVRMIYDERINCAEAAKRLQQKAGAVRVTIHRIRRALQSCVQSRLAEKPV